MCSVVIDIFGNLSERSDDLEQFGSLLAAGFQSTHKLTVNQMTAMWNSTFGTKRQLTYTEALKAALVRLQPFVDLELPDFRFDRANTNMVDVPTFLNSQDEAPQGSSLFVNSSNGKSESARTCSSLSPSPWKTKAFGSPSIAVQQTPVAVTSKRKSRHDDSQVLYVAIESSPLQNIDSESQDLTDRQKEVRARQTNEPAVVFPDLRSSPLPRKGTLGPQRVKTLSLDLKQAELFEDDGPTTPTLPILPNEAQIEEITSSPTPQSKQPALRLDDIEVPSSPPSMPGAAGLEVPAGLVCSDVGALQNDGLNDETDNRLLPPQSHNSDEDLHDEAGGAIPLAEQPQEISTLDVDGEIDAEGLAGVGREEYLPVQASLVDAGSRNADTFLPLAPLIATDGHEMIAVDRSGEDQAQVDSKTLAGGTVKGNIEFSHDGTITETAMTLEKEIHPEYVCQSSVLEEDTTNNEPHWSSVKIQQDTEMAGTLPFRPDDASQAEPEKQTEEDLLLQENLPNDPGLGIPLISDRELDFPAVLSNSSVLTRNSPAASHKSHADGDEVDMLSASQLSQDLDWHIALEQRTSQAEMSPIAQARPITRKRKRSVEYAASPKRRKDVGSPPDRSHPLITERPGTPGQAKTTEEIFDCIVVDTTPRRLRAINQSSQLSPDAMNPQKGSRKRGRKRALLDSTLPDQYLSLADLSSSSQPEVAIEVEAIPLKEYSLSNEEAVVVCPKPEEIFSPSKAPNSVRKVKGLAPITESSTIGSAQPLETHIVANKPLVAVLNRSTASASEDVEDDRAEPSSVPAILHHTPLDKHGGESGMAMVDCAAPTPAQHGRPTPENNRSLQHPRMPENTPPEVETPGGSSGAVAFANKAAAEVDIIGSLQQVLKQLKSTSMGRPALREIDDLLFEIRTEAQHAVGRRAQNSERGVSYSQN